MRQELENIEYIERYLENKLSASDKHKFEQHLNDDADFKAAVELQLMITNRLKEEAFFADVAGFHQTFMAEIATPKKANFLRRFWFIIPCLLLTSFAVFWWVTTPPKPIATTTTLTNHHLTGNTSEKENKTNVLLPSEIHQQVIKVKNKAFEKSFAHTSVTVENGAVIKLPNSNAVLHIPENAVVDKNGKPVSGSFDLQFRELKDQAELAFAGMPMNYKEDDKEYLFNTVGLIELRAFKGGQELQLAPNKEMTLDYEVTERKSNLDLYYFDENTQQWIATSEKVKLPKSGAFTEEIDSARYLADVVAYEKRKAENKPKPTFSREGNNLNVNQLAIQPEGIVKKEEIAPDPNKYLVKHYDNPKLVKALRLNSFGVYNCGQIYQIDNQIAIAAEYTDAQKVVLENTRLLSVVDMNYNAAYSFQPANFICNGHANNVFLLWTTDGKLYSFVKRSTVKLGTGSYSFTMEDMSKTIRNTGDLRRYLKFVEKKVQ